MLGNSTIARRVYFTCNAVNVIKRRQLAALAEKYSPLFVKRKGEQVPVAVQARKTLSKTSQGVTVATYDDMGPVSTLAVVLGGGSRYDDVHHPGLAHMVKTSMIRVSHCQKKEW